MWFVRFKQILLSLIFPWLIALLVQTLGRAYLLINYGSKDILAGHSNDIIQLFIIGVRFDMRTASIIYGTVLIFACLFALKDSLFKQWQKIIPYLSTMLTLVVTWMTVSNVFYYVTYDRYIDLFIFGLIEDDTKAILITLWNDYPIVKGISVLLVFTVLIFYLYRYWQQKLQEWNYKKNHLNIAVPTVLFVFALVFLGVRGSTGTFPLRQSDTQISEVKLLNILTPNGLIALSWAYSDYRKNNHFSDATDQQGKQLLSQFFEQPTAPTLLAFSAKTAKNNAVKRKPPHVVLTVMESLGEHLLTLDNNERDLLGTLRSHWQQDWHFKRFISEGDGTIDTLSRFFVRSPMSNISQSSAQFIDFKSNMFKPFLANGYKIIFITPGNGSWRNLNQFLPHLGVTEFIEQNTLKRLYPEAYMGTWGVPDEYMFRYAEKRLAQAESNGEHLFIMMMSTTFHPPYKAPDNKDYQFKLTDAEISRLSNLAKGKELNEVLNTFRYSNDKLGDFISWVKHNSTSQHTIVAVTGDHNVRGIGYPDPHEKVLGHAVPLYLYVPTDYQINTYFDASRVGSHKDIMPTLYQLSLSTTDYYQTGCNILAKQLSPIWCTGYNPNVFITQEGAYSFTDKAEFRPWSANSGLLLADPVAMNESQKNTYLRWQAFTQLLSWQLNRQVHGQD